MLPTPHGRSSFLHVPPVRQLDMHDRRLVLAREIGPLHWRTPAERIASSLSLVRLPEELTAAATAQAYALAATGVVLVGDSARTSLPVVDAPPASAFDMEVASVRSRRAAWLPATTGISVTALLCSNRPDRLPAALAQMAAQTHRPLQVVVVAHGFDRADVPAAAVDSARGAGLDVQVLEAPAAAIFGEALTLGARAAEGRVVTKVDDDDVYGPHHVTDLLVARAHSGAALVGRALQFVRVEQIDVTARQSGKTSVSSAEHYGTWVCGGTLTIDQDAGTSLDWFDAVPRAVDRNLQDKVLTSGGRIYRTHGLGYVYVRHQDGHTYGTPWAKYLRSSVEQRPGPWDSPEFFAHQSRKAAA